MIEVKCTEVNHNNDIYKKKDILRLKNNKSKGDREIFIFEMYPQ